MTGELRRATLPNYLLGKPEYCTMKQTTNLCKLPGRYPGSYKWPKLAEAYSHIFNEDLQDAHTADADAKACARIFFHLTANARPTTN